MKVAANLTFMFTEAGGLLARYKAAREAGFLAVECAFPYSVPAEEVANALKENGLKQVLINTYPGNEEDGECGFAAMPGKEAEFKDSLEKSITYAKALDCNKLHIMTGKVNREYDDAAHFRTLENNLHHAVNRLEEENIIGLLEPLNKHDKPGYYLNNYNKAVFMLEIMDSANLQLQMDIYHMQLITGNITELLVTLVAMTGHIQVAQPPHRREPSYLGEIDYAYVFKKLRELDYTGYIGAEYKPSVTTENSLGWIEKYGLEF